MATHRPTSAHTYNSGYTFMGAWLRDGECKATATEADIGFMVSHSMDQFVTQDVALYMLTTSNLFLFCRSTKKDSTGHIKTTSCEMNTYNLGQVDY